MTAKKQKREKVFRGSVVLVDSKVLENGITDVSTAVNGVGVHHYALAKGTRPEQVADMINSEYDRSCNLIRSVLDGIDFKGARDAFLRTMKNGEHKDLEEVASAISQELIRRAKAEAKKKAKEAKAETEPETPTEDAPVDYTQLTGKERVKAKKKAYYETHKEEINAKARVTYRFEKDGV